MNSSHFIDKQVFELSCSSESVAAALQKQLLYYTMPALERIIGEIMEELAPENDFYRIDRLEIDLGEWTGAVFGQPAMLDKFREACRRGLVELLNGCRNSMVESLHRPVYTMTESAHGPRNRSGSPILSADDMEWEITRVFLLTGDLPWWTDKSLLPDMDALLTRAIDSVPEQVKSFLEQQRGSSVVFRRLRHQYRKDTLQVLDGLHPSPPAATPLAVLFAAVSAASAASPATASTASAAASTASTASTASAAFAASIASDAAPAQSSAPAARSHTVPRSHTVSLAAALHAAAASLAAPLAASPLHAPAPPTYSSEVPVAAPPVKSFLAATSLYRRRADDGREYRFKILSRLVKEKDTRWLAYLKLLDVLTAEAFGRLETIVLEVSPKNKASDREVLKILRRLTDFQLAFLLRTLNAPPGGLSADASTSISLPTVLTLAGRLTAVRPNSVSRPEDPPAALQEALLQWSEKELSSLLKKGERMETTAKALKKIGRRLAERPALLALLLLHLPAGFGGLDPCLAFVGKKIFLKKTTGLFNWNAGERSALEDILQKGSATAIAGTPASAATSREDPSTSRERKVMTRCLAKLSAPAILQLHRFTHLPEEKIKELLSSVSPVTTMEEKQRSGEESQRILIENAGLCLFAPYLPPFFRNLGYTDGRQFKDIRYACKAIYLLQYIATGKRKAPEYLLPFNKLLCGLPPDTVISGPVRLTKKELAEADTLAEAVISNWPALKNTSVDGLRGSFLCRKGIFRDKGSRQLLQVERKEYDILLNGLTWSYSPIRLPWMKQHIEIEW